MGSLGPAHKRGLLRVFICFAVVIGALVASASAAGPGGWDHLGDRGGPGTDSLDLVASALTVAPGALYVGGEFSDAGGLPDADRISVYALAADSNGTLYTGGGFANLEDIDAADNVAYLPAGGTWQRMGAGGRACDCAVTEFVRGLTAVGTDVYVGTDASDIAGIPQADHVAKWDGSAWSALGSDSGGGNGWFPTTIAINALIGTSTHLFVTGTFKDANGDPRADDIAFFDGTAWHPVGSDGAGNGPWSGNGLALALVDRQLYAAGSFTSAGGDPQAHSVASFALTQIIAYPTPTVTAGPGPVPTPTVTPTPDVTRPATLLRRAQITQSQRRATFRFASGEQGSTFSCKLDKKPFRPCTSPKTYNMLTPGSHVFRVKARDRAGNLDATPAVKRFKIKKR